MKKSILTIIPALAFVAMTMTSCSDECCTIGGVKVCESDLPAGYDNWDAYKTYVTDAGGTCE